jgi:hypothetical protein
MAMLRFDPADLQAFVDRLYGDSKPSGVVDALIRERRREAMAKAESDDGCRRRIDCRD